MKKVFALVLAVAMVLSLSAVAFAASSNTALKTDSTSTTKPVVNVEVNKLYSYTKYDSTKATETPALEAAASITFGKTYYYALQEEIKAETNPGTSNDAVYGFVNDSDAVSKLTVSAKWTNGGDYIKSVEIVKKKALVESDKSAISSADTFVTTTTPTNSSSREVKEETVYLIAVTTTGSSTSDVAVEGEIYLKGKSGADSDKVNGYFSVSFDIAYTATPVAASPLTVAKDDTLYTFDGTYQKESFTIKYGTVATVYANTKNEDKIVLGYDLDEIDEIAEAYDEANLDFVALTGSFKKTAEVTIYADEGSYLYQVVDGKLKAVKAEYDEFEEGFVFNAKTLGTYVISDVELDLNAASSVVADDTTVSANPSTGAAA